MSNILCSNVGNIRVIQLTVDPTSRTANQTTEFDVTVAGVRTTDLVFVNKPSLTAGVALCSARVKSADTVSLTFVNATAGGLDPASETYSFLVIRPETIGTDANM